MTTTRWHPLESRGLGAANWFQILLFLDQIFSDHLADLPIRTTTLDRPPAALTDFLHAGGRPGRWTIHAWLVIEPVAPPRVTVFFSAVSRPHFTSGGPTDMDLEKAKQS